MGPRPAGLVQRSAIRPAALAGPCRRMPRRGERELPEEQGLPSAEGQGSRHHGHVEGVSEGAQRSCKRSAEHHSGREVRHVAERPRSTAAARGGLRTIVRAMLPAILHASGEDRPAMRAWPQRLATPR
eukprot:13154099-Alexandrium_andersonii.AAC.1